MLQPSDFVGTWRLERHLDDRSGQMDGDLRGQAVFTEIPSSRLSYAETGTLALARGGTLVAERRYRWQWRDQEVVVFFNDGAPFHNFSPKGLVAGSTHLCGEDTYNVTYDFRGWPHWTATWDVTGPRKNYTSHSAYAPEPLA
ncbi:MAG: DUF6314 family protein [Pseudomonadota bacterium]